MKRIAVLTGGGDAPGNSAGTMKDGIIATPYNDIIGKIKTVNRKLYDLAVIRLNSKNYSPKNSLIN